MATYTARPDISREGIPTTYIDKFGNLRTIEGDLLQPRTGTSISAALFPNMPGAEQLSALRTTPGSPMVSPSQPGIPTPVQPPTLERLGQSVMDPRSKFYGQDPRSLLDRYQLGEPPMPSWQPEMDMGDPLEYPVGSPQVPENPSGIVTSPIWGMESFIPNESRDFIQKSYGTADYPVFEWARKVQIGTRTFDPNNPEDEDLYEKYKMLTDKSGTPPGFLESEMLPVLALASEKVGTQVFSALTDPYLKQDIPGKVWEGIKTTFTGGTPQQMVEGAKQAGLRAIESPIPAPKMAKEIFKKLGVKNIPGIKYLSENQVFQPELADRATAVATGNLEAFTELHNRGAAIPLNYSGSGEDRVVKSWVYKKEDINDVLGKTDESPWRIGDDLSESRKFVEVPGVEAPDPEDELYSELTGSEDKILQDELYSELAGSRQPLTNMESIAGDDLDWPSNIGALDPVPSNIHADAITGSTTETATTPLTSPSAWKEAGAGAAVNFGFRLMSGQKPVEAVKATGAGVVLSMVGKTLGGSIGGPIGAGIGGFLGSALGGMVGGRVICNELHRQGFLERRQVILDYKFTREHLTPKHVKGYHVWATHVVRKLREGKQIPLWRHMAIHRAREIEYIYGERDKPDYLGKIYRHIGEPICWVLGNFCKETDWSVLYQPKEI